MFSKVRKKTGLYMSVPRDQLQDRVQSMQQRSVLHRPFPPLRAGKIVSDTLESEIIPGMSRMMSWSKCKVELHL